ncbi:MAG: lysoplasmalogenase [Cytophagales bacterium]|nr:lysoplasmalogenase [Bernardetiaceae bacterium]MDW8203943.1 lysoplasmalogenase [Cytophagales bacterium]
MKHKTNFWQTAYFAVGAVNLLGHLLKQPILVQVSKPLLMPLLAILFYINIHGKKASNTAIYAIIAALAFSFVGDVALMIEGYFMLGLGAFLLAHVSYIFAFTYLQKFHLSLGRIVLKPVVLLLFAAGIGMYTILSPHLGAMRTAVGVYVAVIVVMAVAAYLLVQRIAGRVFVGAVLFLISDSYLAFNKFYTPLPLAGVVVMGTYIAAQWCITKGVSHYFYD